MAVALLTPEELEALVRRAVEPLREEIARLRGERDQEGVTVEEAARRLSVSVSTIERRVRDGSLPSIKVGGVRRVQLAAVLPGNDEIVVIAHQARRKG